MKTLQDQRVDLTSNLLHLESISSWGDSQWPTISGMWKAHGLRVTSLDNPVIKRGWTVPALSFCPLGESANYCWWIAGGLLVDFRFPVGSTMWSTPSASVRCRVNQRVETQQVGPCSQLTWVTPERPWRVPMFLRDQRITTYQTWLAGRSTRGFSSSPYLMPPEGTVNLRGWIAGSNPFCQLIEIRTLGCPEF